MNDHGLSASAIDAFWMRSKLAVWMQTHRADIADYFDSGEADWKRMANVFRDRSEFIGLGDLPSPAFLQDIWMRLSPAFAD